MVDTDRVTGAAKELGGKVQGALGDLTGSKQDSIEGRAREAAGQAENVLGQTKDAARDAAATAANYAEDAYEHAGDYVREGAREIRHQVSAHPLASLLLAGLVGFGLSLLINAGRD